MRLPTFSSCLAVSFVLSQAQTEPERGFAPPPPGSKPDDDDDPPPPRGTKQPGLMFHLTNKGLQMATRGLSMAAQEMMNHMVIEDYVRTNGSAEALRALKIDAVDIKTAFKENEGIAINMTIPKFETRGSYKVTGVSDQSFQNVTSKVSGLASSLLLKIKPGGHHQPIFEIPNCTVQINKVDPTPTPTKPEKAGGKDRAVAFVRSALGRRLHDAVCRTARITSRMINAGFFHLGHKIPSFADASPGRSGGKKFDLSVLCGYKHDHGDAGHIDGYLNTFLQNVTRAIGGDLQLQTRMDQLPTVTKDHLAVGVAAEFAGKAAQRAEDKRFHRWSFGRGASTTAPRPVGDVAAKLDVTRTDKDVCLGVGEPMINSLLQQAHERNFFSKMQNVSQDAVPAPILVLLKKLLPKSPDFQICVNTTTEQPPKIRFLATASRITAKLIMRFSAKSGSKTEKMIEALADIDILPYSYIEKDYVKSNISLGPAPRITLKNVFTSGMLESHANEFVNKALRKTLWPHVETRYNEMMGGGIKLPAPCGLSLKDPQIVRAPGFLKVCTDLAHDTEALIRRFDQWQLRKTAASAT